MSARKPVDIRHEFVETIPEQLEEKVLYISISRRIALHRCLCGCSQEVATPLSPREWRLLFDGETVSLFPSVGVWGMPCQSHYWIRNDQVIWSKRLSRDRIERLRRREHLEARGLEAAVDEKATTGGRARLWRRRSRQDEERSSRP
jgi:hypothetical protein